MFGIKIFNSKEEILFHGYSLVNHRSLCQADIGLAVDSKQLRFVKYNLRLTLICSAIFLSLLSNHYLF